MKLTYRSTMFSCFAGYIVQAIVNNFVPLLFLTFQKEYNLTLGQVIFIITLNFAVQLAIDAISAVFIDRMDYRISMAAAHISAAAGFILMTILPNTFGYAGILTSVLFYAVGGGLLEVVVSPMIEACPTKNKKRQ